MESFVGFAASPKPRPGAKLLTQNLEIESELGIRECLAIVTTQAGLESWLGILEKFDFRQGAKLAMTRSELKTGLSFAQINIPKSVILVTEVFGQIQFGFKEKKDKVIVKIRFSKAVTPEELQTWETDVAEAKSVISGELGV